MMTGFDPLLTDAAKTDKRQLPCIAVVPDGVGKPKITQSVYSIECVLNTYMVRLAFCKKKIIVHMKEKLQSYMRPLD